MCNLTGSWVLHTFYGLAIRAMAFFATDCHSDIVEEFNE